MGFFFRKLFRLGPARLNLSKSGLEISAGIKGARVGIGPRGPYVSAAKDRIYYRRHLGGAVQHATTGQPGAFEGPLIVVLVAFAVILVAFVGFVAWALFK